MTKIIIASGKRIAGLILLLLSFSSIKAASVDTVAIYSPAMQKTFKCVVIKPDAYRKKKTDFPVVYLLHGYAGWYSNWIIRVPELKEYADRYNLMIVCPDGGFSSWYLDSPVDSTMKYETYIGKEVPEFIDSHYHTRKDRSGRAITGLSMGGHGGLLIGFRHAGFFGACGSMSGGVDLNSNHTRFDVIKRVGDTVTQADNWNKNSVINIIEQYPGDSIAIIFDCGIADIFYPDNLALHEKMLKRKIPHDYIERPGKHDWNYWRTAVKFQLLFFRDYFDRKKKS